MAGLIIAILLLTGGGGAPARAATGFKYGGTPVYGAVGPEGIPLEEGKPLSPAYALAGGTVGNVSCSSTEQLAYHRHVHLAIFVHGQPRSVPPGVGMEPPVQTQDTRQGKFAVTAKCFYWLHTHAQDGVIHIESPVDITFTLGSFFALWHQSLSSNQIGPYSGSVVATVDGARWSGDPSTIPLKQHAQIVLNLGRPVVKPPPISWAGTGL